MKMIKELIKYHLKIAEQERSAENEIETLRKWTSAAEASGRALENEMNKPHENDSRTN